MGLSSAHIMTCYITEMRSYSYWPYPDNSHIRSYPKDVSDSMQEDMRHKKNQKED